MKFELQPLPYPKDALGPHISARTVDIHYEKHHRGYLDKLRTAIEGTPGAEQSLEQFISSAVGQEFNWAAQVWNHDFYWRSMKPKGGGKPPHAVADALKQDFGSVDSFCERFAEVAKDEFGSGWAWLVSDRDRRLEVMNTNDAENPLKLGCVPLLCLDVWEHAYYLDHQSDRGRYIQGFIDGVLDWDFVARNLAQARQLPQAGKADSR